MSAVTTPKRPPGRPALPPEQRAEPRSIRLDSQRWAKLQALGTDWLKRQIDRAKP